MTGELERIDDADHGAVFNADGHAADVLRTSPEQVHAAASAAVDAERRRIARDLHDGAQQHLAALAIRLALLTDLVQGPAETLVGSMTRDLDQAVDDLRALIAGIYPPVLLHDGLAAAVTHVTRDAPVPTRVRADLDRLPEAIEGAAYFICLEAFQNALKHAAPATRVDITLAARDQRLEITVEDDGVGLTHIPITGGGVESMRRRAEGVHGHLQVGPAAGIGTRVQAVIPLPAPDGAAPRQSPPDTGGADRA